MREAFFASLGDLVIDRISAISIQDLNDLIVIKEKFGRRKFRQIPLCAYNKENWLSFFCSVFYDITGEKYNIQNRQGEYSLLDRAYRMIFFKRFWSAREFGRFLVQAITESHGKSKVFTLKTFANKNPYIEDILKNYNKKIEAKRDNDIFEDLIHVPFYPLSGGRDAIFCTLSEIGDDVIKICFNYGIPNYTRFLQIYYNITMQESVDLTRKRMSKTLVPLPENVRIRIFDGFARNSILWEPYITTKESSMKGEENVIINWRPIYSKIWDKYNFKEKDWWREKSETYKEKRLISVKDFFSDRKRR